MEIQKILHNFTIHFHSSLRNDSKDRERRYLNDQFTQK